MILPLRPMRRPAKRQSSLILQLNISTLYFSHGLYTITIVFRLILNLSRLRRTTAKILSLHPFRQSLLLCIRLRWHSFLHSRRCSASRLRWYRTTWMLYSSLLRLWVKEVTDHGTERLS